jgi:CRISPR-associated endonuclease Csn1
MPQNLQDRPYILGLDLGVQSLGWAVIDIDEEGVACRIRRTGVRCFDSGVGNEKEIAAGKDESSNAKRREARQHRRQLWRRAQRLRTVLHVLRAAGLLPDGPTEPQRRHDYLLRLDAELAAQSDGAENRVEAHLLPYRLRTAALNTPLSPFALGRAFYHLAQRRGFLSNRKARKDTEEEGVVKEGIAGLQQLMTESGARTLGEYFAGLDPEEQRIRGRFTSRAMYQDEFEKIWTAQLPHHLALTEEIKQKLHRAIFFQRPLKSQSGLIGKCELEPGQRRAAVASLDAQRFRYWQKINDLEIIAPDGEIRCLTAEERGRLAVAFETQGDLTFSKIRTLLNLKKPKGEDRGHVFNLEEGGEKKLLGNRTAVKLAHVLCDRWQDMPVHEQDRLVREILAFEHEDALARRLVKAWGFDPATAQQLATLDFEPGYSGFSLRAIVKLLPRLQAGERLNSARHALYGEQLAEGHVFDLLPPVRQAVPSLRNPVVCRVLTETRKIVNALVREYGRPDMIRIELARDMKKGRQQRKTATKQMRENEQRRDKARREIKMLAELGISEPRPGDILKFLLAEECNWECPYTGRTITPRTLLGSAPEFDVEHIWPFSRSLDNSFLNKTLCYHEENRSRKQNRTPWEAYCGDEDRWGVILQRVRRFRGSGADAKLRRFQAQDMPADFAARQLNDTRYASRLAADYVALLFGKRVDEQGRLRVQVSAGRTTAFLRDQWGLNSILSDGGEKAGTITAITRSTR